GLRRNRAARLEARRGASSAPPRGALRRGAGFALSRLRAHRGAAPADPGGDAHLQLRAAVAQILSKAAHSAAAPPRKRRALATVLERGALCAEPAFGRDREAGRRIRGRGNRAAVRNLAAARRPA